MSIRNELLEKILSEVAGQGGGAVLTVTGDLVDNTDPINPIVNFPAALATMLNTRASIGNVVANTGILGPISLIGTGDETSPTPVAPQPPVGGNYNGYVKIEGIVEIDASGELSVSNNEIVVGSSGAGDYRIPHAWLGMSSSTNNNVIAFSFGIEKQSTGLIHFTNLVTTERGSAQSQPTNISTGGFIIGLEPGDKLSVWVAAALSCNLSVYDSNLGMEMAIPASLKV